MARKLPKIHYAKADRLHIGTDDLNAWVVCKGVVIDMNLLKFCAGAMAAAFGLCALPAAAATVIVIGTSSATITCSVSCQGFVGAGGLDDDPGAPDVVDPTGIGTLSSVKAQLYNGAPNDANSQRARLDTLDDGLSNFSVSCSGFCVDPSGQLDGNGQFVSSALYIVLKLGNNNVFIKNTSGGAQTYSYVEAPSLGFSGYREFGGEIPVPAAVWLMVAGLAGLGFAGRMKKQA